MVSTEGGEKETRRRPPRASRNRVIAGGGGLAAALMAASVAFACTATMGPLTISPTQGKPGTVITASATGLKPLAYYNLNFNNATRLSSGRSCHTAPTVMRTVQASSTGAFSGVKATIPTNAPKGNSQVCAVESSPVAGATASSHELFVVV
jgi:hypothetical protein